MHRDNYIHSLRNELLEKVSRHLTPVALRYGYSKTPLQAGIKWRPLVLLLGNYSSGKSTLINEFVGAGIQATGQAPTDDSFTIITYDDSLPEGEPIRVTEERDGQTLLNDPAYPFENLKTHGQRFISHFRLKKVNSPFLKNLALIDTPGMLDSITERDRGYDYQKVIGELAQTADLILILFDPHKAGTVRECYTSLRETLPVHTFEDRLLFVLNRIDECASLVDLLRVYGTLCWNLSQITGRKDIPMIHLTYSPQAADENFSVPDQNRGYLRYLENQREELKQAILKAPRFRLYNLARFIETHSERLSHFLEALISYRRRYNAFLRSSLLKGLLLSLLSGGFMTTGMTMWTGDLYLSGIAGGAMAILAGILWTGIIMKRMKTAFHQEQLEQIDELTPLITPIRRDSWSAVKAAVCQYLVASNGKFSLKDVLSDHEEILRLRDTGCREIREALNELTTRASTANR
jgi:GTPase SAR1 family protein